MSQFATGYIPRDYSAYPSGYLACAPEAPEDWIFPENEWDERLKEQQANFASLWDLRERFYDKLKSLNQTTHPLCWAFSTTKAAMYLEAVMGTPTILSAWWTAGMANGWRNEGGWNTLSLKAFADVGGLPLEDCPEFSSKYATAENKAIASKRRVIEWYDGSQNRDRNRAIMISAFLRGLAPVGDHNDIGHSMCGCRIVQLKPTLIVDYDNSWGGVEQYGPKGIYRRTGNQAIPDGLVVPRVIQPTA